MQPLSDWPKAARKGLRGVFFDIDDTLTTDGRLTAEAYAGMQMLQTAELTVVPITGRPAGWCDHIARMWPVDAVVGENGAFYFRYEHARRHMQRRYMEDGPTRAKQRDRFLEIGKEIVARVHGASIAADQTYRESDLAIDYCEDVDRLPDSDVGEIVAIMQSHGMTAKVSSIHVNGWFGTYDKLSMTQTLMRECFDTDLECDRAFFAFVGDSPNDAPMFAFLANSIGVANVRDFEDQLVSPPRYVTRARAGAGFRETVEAILGARR